MSLGKLLTSGKSLVGLHSDEGRYEMRAKNLLPKFGSEKNPFSTVKPQSLRPAPVEKIQTVARTLTPSEAAAAKLKETKKLPAVTSIKPAEKVEPGFVAKFTGAVSAGFGKLTSLFRRPATRADKKTIPQFGKTPVQAELSLDRIKPIRNDLSEADVEVVPAKISVEAKAEPVVQPAAKAVEAPELIKT
jgi:hypothetical protein